MVEGGWGTKQRDSHGIVVRQRKDHAWQERGVEKRGEGVSVLWCRAAYGVGTGPGATRTGRGAIRTGRDATRTGRLDMLLTVEVEAAET